MLCKLTGRYALIVLLAVAVTGLALAEKPASQRPPKSQERLYLDPVDVNPPSISKDKSIRYDYDIVCVRGAAGFAVRFVGEGVQGRGFGQGVGGVVC